PKWPNLSLSVRTGRLVGSRCTLQNSREQAQETEGKITKTRSGSSSTGSGCRSRPYKLLAVARSKRDAFQTSGFRARATELSGQPRTRSLELSPHTRLAATARRPQRIGQRFSAASRGLDTLASVNEQGVNNPQINHDANDRPKRLSRNKQEIAAAASG